MGAIFWITTVHGRGKHSEAEGKECSHATGVIKQAKTWMAQILYHAGTPCSHERHLRKQLLLWGHLDREHKVALRHRQLGEMQQGKRRLFAAAKLARGNRRESGREQMWVEKSFS